MNIGYARVSTEDQNLQLQRDALNQVGCERTYEDQVSGAREKKPGLDQVLEVLREGDTLVVWKLDRLGRSVKQLITFVEQLESMGVQFKSITDSIDTGTPAASTALPVTTKGVNEAGVIKEGPPLSMPVDSDSVLPLTPRLRDQKFLNCEFALMFAPDPL